MAEFWPTLAVGVAARTAQFLCLEAAVERELDFSDGHSVLAAAYINGHKFNYAHSRPDAIERAYPRIQGAIVLNSQNQRAYQMLAIYRYLTE